MSHDSDFEYFEKMAHWTFDEYGIHEECLTDWDLYGLLAQLAGPDSHILDLGTAGGEKVLEFFPGCAEILCTDYSPAMIETARANLAKSGRKNSSFYLKRYSNTTLAVTETSPETMAVSPAASLALYVFRRP